jgi:multiple sugar transport system permease protein
MRVDASHTVATRNERQAKRQSRFRGQIAAYLFLAPALVLFTLFAWYPILNSLLLSLQNFRLSGESEWVGLQNFQRMFADPNFITAWRNSVEFAAISIVIGFFIPIIVAVMVNEVRVARGFFRLVYFLPSVIPSLIAVLIWQQIYAPEGGFLNGLVGLFGVRPQRWLFDVSLVKPSIILILTWSGFGGTMLIYLASLQDLPTELYEAAEIDGASVWHRIRHITVPHMRPLIIVMLVLQIIGVVQIFLEPFVLTGGGPGNSTTTPVLIIYTKAFNNYDFGVASAWSVVLIIVLAVFSAIYLRLTRSNSRSE